MINYVIEGKYDLLYISLGIAAWCNILVAFAIGFDFYYGITKAKELSEPITSEGYRRTVKKARYYFSLLLFALKIDTINVFSSVYLPHPISLVPLVTLITCIGLIITEYKSIREKAEDKYRRNADESFKQLYELVRNRGDLFEKLYEQYKQEKEKK